MDEIRQTQKKYGSRAMTVAIISGFFLILSGYAPIGKGLILGTIFSVVNFVLMGETLPLRIGKSKPKTFFIALGSIGVRYGILAVPLIMGIRMAQFNLIAVISGMFMVQICILLEHLALFTVSSKEKSYFEL